MKKITLLLMGALLALAVRPVLAETNEKPLTLVELGAGADSTDESSAWPALDDVKSFPADAIQQVEVIFSTEGGAQRFVFTDSAIIADLQMFCGELALGDETDIGVADDGLTLTFSTVWESATFCFEGDYAVIEDRRYAVEHLNWLKTYLKAVTESEIPLSDS